MTTSVVTKALRWVSNYRGPVAATPANASDVRAGVEDMGSALYWLKTFVHDVLIGVEQRIIGRSGNQLEITGHGLASNAAVRVFASPGASLPTPLAANTVYYVRSIDADHIELSATSGPGAAITLTSGLSGDVWIQSVANWIGSMLVSDGIYGTGTLSSLVMWLAGSQTVTGAKTFADVTLSGTAKVKLAARSMTRLAGQNVIMGVVGTTIPTTVTNNASTATVVIPIDPPHGSSITAVAVRVDPSVHASLPANMPKIGLYRKDNTEVDAVIDEFEDDSVDAAAYSAAHDITLSLGSPLEVDRSAYNYFIYFTPEHGADSAVIPLRGAWFTFSTSAYDDGAG